MYDLVINKENEPDYAQLYYLCQEEFEFEHGEGLKKMPEFDKNDVFINIRDQIEGIEAG